MTEDQAVAAVPLLNSYAHQYLGLSPSKVLVGGGHGPNGWKLIVAVKDRPTAAADDFDAAKRMIDEVSP